MDDLLSIDKIAAKNTKPEYYVFRGEQYEVKTWKDLLLSFCELLIEIDATRFIDYTHYEDEYGRPSGLIRLTDEGREGMDIVDIAGYAFYICRTLKSKGICSYIAALMRFYMIPVTEMKVKACEIIKETPLSEYETRAKEKFIGVQLYLSEKQSDVRATGIMVSPDKIMVKKGSMVQIANTTKYLTIHKRQQKLIQNGIIKNNRFDIDHVFAALSTAADVIRGQNTNGKAYWHLGDGTSYKTALEAEERRLYEEDSKANEQLKIPSPQTIKAEQDADEDLIDSLVKENFEIKDISEDARIMTAPRAKPKPTYVSGKAVYPRDRATAMRSLALAEYKCEIDSGHITFLRKHSEYAYTEPHHLIPMAYQDQFDASLDVEANIVSLCCTCHKQIHYGAEAVSLVERLYEERKERLDHSGLHITLKQLLQIYE